MTRRDDFADRYREGSKFRRGRHRRLAKAGSPATARGCGELAKGSPRRGRCPPLSSTFLIILFRGFLSPQPPPFFSFEILSFLIHLLTSLSRHSLSSTVTIVLFGDFSLVYCPGEQKLLSLHIGHQKGAPRGAEIIPSNLMQLVLP